MCNLAAVFIWKGELLSAIHDNEETLTLENTNLGCVPAAGVSTSQILSVLHLLDHIPWFKMQSREFLVLTHCQCPTGGLQG